MLLLTFKENKGLKKEREIMADKKLSKINWKWLILYLLLGFIGWQLYKPKPKPPSPPPLLNDPIQILIKGGEKLPPLGKFKVVAVHGKIALGKKSDPHEPEVLLEKDHFYYTNDGTTSKGEMILLVERGTEKSVSLKWKKVKW